MTASRRSFLAGLGSLLAAPAIVRAEILMPVRAIIAHRRYTEGSLLTVDMIAREAVKLFTNCNRMLQDIELQYRADYAFVAGPQWTNAELDADGARYFAGFDEPAL